MAYEYSIEQAQIMAERFASKVQRSLLHSAPSQHIQYKGRVTRLRGTLLEASLKGAKIGELCYLESPSAATLPGLAEVVGFDDQTVLLSALSSLGGISGETLVRPLGLPHQIQVNDRLFGQVLDGFGRAMPGSRSSASAFTDDVLDGNRVCVMRDNVDATHRPRIQTPLFTGVRAIDTLLTLGEGQRIGIFAGAGCGKTTLLSAIARGANADAIVFGLIGERGRELNEFIEHELDETLLKRTIVVCATSDKTAMERARAAFTCTAIAECLRDQGKRVLLLIDSLTRLARAQREIGLAVGEPPAKAGFPPSVYALLPRLIERAGSTEKGSITAIYTVLIEQDSMGDPIADETRSLTDGHIILSRKLAQRGHYPAIDVLASLSRIMGSVVDPDHMAMAQYFRELSAKYDDLEMLIRLGEYTPGHDAQADFAVARHPQMMSFLKQDNRVSLPPEISLKTLTKLLTAKA